MKVRFSGWIFIIFLIVGIFVPGKVLAQAPGGNPCDGAQCGGEWAGPGICIPYACPGDPPPPDNTSCGGSGGACGGIYFLTITQAVPSSVLIFFSPLINNFTISCGARK